MTSSDPTRIPRGNGALPVAASGPVTGWKAFLVAFAVLQGVGAGLLVVAWVLLRGLLALLAPGASDLATSWGAVFVLVPVSFVPGLVGWHSWVCRRLGRRPRLWRLVAELAFAVEVVGFALFLGLA